MQSSVRSGLEVRASESRRGDLLRVLGSVGWLADRPAAFREALLANGRVERFRRGDLIFRKGDPAGGLYGLVEGTVIYYRNERPDPVRAIHISHPGAWFGEPSMLRRKPRLVSAAALDGATLFHLPIDRFEAMVEAEPAYWQHFALLALNGVEVLLQLLDDMRPVEPRARVAARLLNMLRGDPPGRSSRSDTLSITQTDLAGLTSLSRNTVNRVLQELAAAGILEPGYGRIVIHDVEALRREIA